MADDRVWSRRRWLTVAGSATAATLAGCSSSDDSGDGAGTPSGGEGSNGANPAGQDGSGSSGPVTAEGEWPMELFDAANTASTTAVGGPAGSLTERWSKDLSGMKSVPIVSGDTVYAGVNEDGCYAFDLLSGEQLWKHESETVYLWVAASEDRVYVSSSGIGGRFTAHDPANGDILWEYGPAGQTYLRVVDDTIYLVVDAGIVALDKSGTERWKTPLPSKPVRPAISDGTVFVNYGSKVGALDATSGEQRWERDYGGTLNPRGIVADEERVYYIGNGTIEARDRSTGDLTWTWSEGSRNPILPAIADGVAYVSVDLEGDVVGIDVESGETVSRYELGSYVSGISVADGTLYAVGSVAGGSDRTLYTIDIDAGSVTSTKDLQGRTSSYGPAVPLEDLLLLWQQETLTVFESA